MALVPLRAGGEPQHSGVGGGGVQSLEASLPDGEVIFHLGLGAGCHAEGVFGEARAAEERLQSSRLEVLHPEILSYSVSFQGICFIRTSRPENAIIYNNNEDFQIGQAKVSVVYAPMRPHRESLRSGPTPVYQTLSLTGPHVAPRWS